MATWRGALVLGTLLLAFALLVPVRAGDNDDNTQLWLWLNLPIAAAVLVYVLANIGMQFAGVDADAPQLARHLAAHPEQQRLLTRWLERARWARFVGGFAGLVAWVLATNLRGSVLLFGTAGIFVGAVLAELHHVRRPAGPRTARLEVRTIGDYLLTSDARWMIGVGIAALVATIVGALDDGTRAASWWALAALGVLGLTRLVQQRVASRARPAVSPELTRADDLARELAIGRGLARPATYVGLALISEAADSLQPLLGGAASLLTIACWLTAFVRWWQNRRLGLDFLMQVPRAPVVS
jgi:hypothetical protein